jgi:two-component system, LuxR family, response regulator FixJ
MSTEAGVVHVIDDDEAVRESLAFLLETADLTVRTYESAAGFLDGVGAAERGCVITDVRMPGMSGLELVREMNARGISLPVVVMTGHGDVPLAVEAMRAGVVDFIEKPFGDETILAALRAALAVGHDRLGKDSERAMVAGRLDSLSTRERQVLAGLVEGQSNKAVAQALGISPRTVEVYRANLMAKMRASSLSELVRMTLLAGRPS